MVFKLDANLAPLLPVALEQASGGDGCEDCERFGWQLQSSIVVMTWDEILRRTMAKLAFGPLQLCIERRIAVNCMASGVSEARSFTRGHTNSPLLRYPRSLFHSESFADDLAVA